MKTKRLWPQLLRELSKFLPRRISNKGQTLVEFTLVFILLIVIAWIPADFGLAFFTSQLAQNAAREGARIAAADPGATAYVDDCDIADCYALDQNHPLYRAATRMSRALMPNANIALTMPGATCNQQVQVTVQGTYNYFFYRLLGWFGITVPQGSTITRTTSMRWEHQC